MEEIDIIELLKRVKEGKAPKEIEIGKDKLFYHPEEKYFERLYQTKNNSWWSNSSFITLDTKIKILDKLIIEELEIKDEGSKYISPDTFEITTKVNEIIKFINNKE